MGLSLGARGERSQLWLCGDICGGGGGCLPASGQAHWPKHKSEESKAKSQRLPENLCVLRNSGVTFTSQFLCYFKNALRNHTCCQEDTAPSVRAAPAIPGLLAAGTWAVLKCSELGYCVGGHTDTLLLCCLSSPMWMSPLVQFVAQGTQVSGPSRPTT